jgi:hypothetical protein
VIARSSSSVIAMGCPHCGERCGARQAGNCAPRLGFLEAS